MKDRIRFHSKYAYLLIAFILFWFVFFFFILSSNFILPRPYFVLLSVGDLFRDYNFIPNIFSTISVIYFSIISAFFILWAFRVYLINGNNSIRYIVAALGWLTGFIPSILIVLFLVYWLGDSEYIKYIFGFFTCFISLFIKLENEINKVGDEYIDSALSLGANKRMITGKIKWKSVEPAIVNYIPEIHLYLWSMIIIIEFIKGGSGLGVVFRQALSYKDLPVLFLSSLITLIVIFTGESLIKYLYNKYFSRSTY